MAIKWLEVYGAVISSTFMAMTRGTCDIKGAKEGLHRLLTETTEDGEKPWRKFIIRAGDGSVLEDTTNNPLKNFREFIEAQPLRGLGQSVADIERLLGDDPEALERLRDELKEDRGGNRNPGGRNQYDEVNANNVSIDLFTEAPKSSPKPDRKTEHGNRKDYTLSRLKREAPALFDEVKAGRMSANAAALEAGIRKPMRSIPVDTPDAAIRALLRVFTVTDLAQALGKAAEVSPPS